MEKFKSKKLMFITNMHIIVLFASFFIVSCSHIQDAQMKQTDLDIYFNKENGDLTQEGNELLSRAMDLGIDLLSKVDGLSEVYNERCSSCNKKMFSDMFFYNENTNDFKIKLCPECAIVESVFSIGDRKFTSCNGKVTVFELPKDSNEEEGAIAEKNIVLANSSKLCDVFLSMYTISNYIGSFERRPMEERMVPNDILNLGEDLERYLPTGTMPYFLLYNAYIASLYKNQFPENFGIENSIKLFFQKTEGLSIDLSLNMLVSITDFCKNQLKREPSEVLENIRFFDKICRHIVPIVSLYLKNNSHASLKQNLVQCIHVNALRFLLRYTTEPLASIPDITKINPIPPQFADVIVNMKAIEPLIDSVPSLKASKREMPAPEIFQPIERVNFDSYYNHEENIFTEEGKKFLVRVFDSIQTYTSITYGPPIHQQCIVCGKPIDPRMALDIIISPSDKICALCVFLKREVKYNEEDYKIVNERLCLKEGAEYIKNREHIAIEMENVAVRGSIMLTSNTNMYSIMKTAFEIFKILACERRRQMSDRINNLQPSEFIEANITAQNLHIYLFYLAHAACLHFEYKLMNLDNLESNEALNSNIWDAYTLSLGMDSLLAPVYIITYLNKEINEKNSVDIITVETKERIYSAVSKYLAKLPIRKKLACNDNSQLIVDMSSFTADAIKKHVHQMFEAIFLKKSIGDNEGFDEFCTEFLIKIGKIDLSLEKYEVLQKKYLEKRWEKKFCLTEDAESVIRGQLTNENSLCKKVLFAIGALQLPLYLAIRYIISNELW